MIIGTKRIILLFVYFTVIPCTGMYALKPKYLEIDAALNTLFGHFWITALMPHLILRF